MSKLTRRSVLAGVAASPMVETEEDSDDPMLALWQEWCTALKDARAKETERRRIEREMVARFGYPRVLVARGAGGRRDIYATTERDVTRALVGAADAKERYGRLVADLDQQQERWDMEAQRLGLDVMEREEDAAWKRVDVLTARAEHVPARSLRGIVVKLTVAVALRETYGAEETEFPWPILGAALKDLQTMTGA